jgi:hypothetical protein
MHSASVQLSALLQFLLQQLWSYATLQAHQNTPHKPIVL